MKVFCRELNKEFSSKEEMFVALKQNKDRIIALKKAAVKESDAVAFAFVEVKGDTVKSVEGEIKVEFGDNIYPVINTTNWLDSHGDVHLDGIWDVTIKDQQGKVYYAVNHKLEIGSIISYPNEVEPMVKTMNWTDLGQNSPGTTQALIFAAKLTDKSNEDAVKAIKGGVPLENSIRMQYVTMDLCVDSNSKGMEQERMNFYMHLPKIANKEDAQTAGYFWAVSQAKIVKEGSAVLAGSNRMTPILYTDPSNKQSEKETQSPPDSSVEKKISFFHTLI